MRDRLIEDFRPDHNQGYTYKELLALRAAGKDIPDHWIIRAKRTEDADAEDRELSKAIAADLKAAEKAREQELAEKDDRVLPKLQAMADELTELKADAEEKRSEAFAAIKAYRDAYRAAAGKHGSMRRTAREEYGGPAKDDDGNALPGQTFAHSDGDVILKGEKVTPPGLDPALDSPLLRGL